MTDILIIGAGINGLLLSRELADADLRITLLEKSRCCREASWAGGGIISPLYPWRYSQPVTALANWAQDYYPQLAADLMVTTGIDPELSRSGLLMLDAADEREALRWAKVNCRPMKPVDTEFIYRKEPALAAGFASGLWMPDVANVRNPRLGQALLSDLKTRSNVKILEECQVELFVSDASETGIRAVQVLNRGRRERIEAERFVLCAGAWSGLLARCLKLELAVEPVKGQMLLYQFKKAPVQAIVLAQGRYVIPRRDGHVLVGSTLEYADFDKTPTQAARESLRESAARLLPMLKTAEPIAQWAGLRPAAPNGVPFIGRLGNYRNLYVNAGQFRNGLVLAPASARLMADLLLGRKPVVDPLPYRPVTRVLVTST